MKYLEKDPRGLPVPFVVLKDETGKHHFKINDTKKSEECINKRLCHICGNPLNLNNLWMIGGPGSTFDENGMYIDGPVHKECGLYALQVCPYLAYSGYTAKTDIEKLQQQIKDKSILFNPTVDNDRLPLFVFARASQLIMHISPTGKYFSTFKPLLEIEFWNDGELITEGTEVKNKLLGTKWEKYWGIYLNMIGYDKH
jgi:hypothetical protein